MRTNLMTKKPSFVEDRRNESISTSHTTMQGFTGSAYYNANQKKFRAGRVMGPELKPRQAVGETPENALAITSDDDDGR